MLKQGPSKNGPPNQLKANPLLTHPSVILHQELMRNGAQKKRKGTTQSSSQSHSEGKSSSSRSGGAVADNGSSTPSKSSIKRKGVPEGQRIHKGQQFMTKSLQGSGQHLLNPPSTIIRTNQQPQKVTQKADKMFKQKRPSVDEAHGTRLRHHANGGPPTIVFNLDELKVMSSQGPIISANKNELHTLGYKSFISLAAKQDKQPESTKEPRPQDSKIHSTYLDQTIDEVPHVAMKRSSAKAEKHRPIGNSPPGEKIVIKKSEIKFSASPSSSPQPQLSGFIQFPAAHDLSNQTKKEAMPESKAKGSPKKDAQSTLKISLSGGLSPYSMIGKTKPMKSELNFDKEMKKHGIDKDIASVRSSRQILKSSSPQAVSPTMMVPVLQNAIKEQESRDQIARRLQIKTIFKPGDVGIDSEESQAMVGSAKSESYVFPFHKRSRSLSPDLPNLPPAAAAFQQVTDNNEIPSTSNTQESSLPILLQRGQLSVKKSYERLIAQGVQRGPVIPLHADSMESLIKATCGSPGMIFYQSNAKQYQSQREQASTERLQEQEDLERRILAGTEVEEWLESPSRPQRILIVSAITEESKQQPLLTTGGTSYHPFSKIGFYGDTDDLEEDDIEQDMAGDDDWMFQTFQKTAKAKARAREKQNDTLQVMPQCLLASQDNLKEDSSEDLQQLEIDVGEDERAIPIENMGLLGSLLSDHALDFTK